MPDEPKTLRQIRVFVSSPGDVAEERRVLAEVVEAVNRDVGEANSVVLRLLLWETDVVPKIGPSPQQVVDDQTPLYDIFLGIMSSRFGTPTDKWGSGTEHEFRKALERWSEGGKLHTAWILFYFNDEPPRPKTPAAALEFAKVLEFRQELEALGIVGSYDKVQGGSSSFEFKVGEHLRQIILKDLAKILPVKEAPERPSRRKGAQPSETLPGKLPSVPKAYRDWLCSQCSDISLLGLDLKQAQSVQLNHVYVPLSTHTAEERRHDERDREPFERGQEEKPQLLLDMLGMESLYVPGAPGSGKSTFCRWVAWLACTGEMPSKFTESVEAPSAYQESFPEALRDRLTVLIRLREFWPYLPSMPDYREISQGQLEQSMSRWFEEQTPSDIGWAGDRGWADVEYHLVHGSAFLILDGADEVPLSHGDERKPCSPREMLLSGLAAAIPVWTRNNNRILLTSRPYGLSRQESRRLGLRHAPILELAQPMQDLLIRRWFCILNTDASKAEETARDMISHIREREGLEPLASNPMLLTAMCIIYSEGKRLPQDKHDLYTRIVGNVLYNRFHRDPVLIDPVRNRLAVIAYGMHTGEGLREERSMPQAEVTNDEIDKILREYQDRIPYTETAFRDAVDARDQLLSKSGLLLPRGEDRAGFYHLSFQEFLAAQRLLDLEEDRLPEAFRDRAPVPEWRNTLSFVFGSHLAKSSSPDRSTRLLAALVRGVSHGTLGLHVVVADCLQILLGRGIRLPVELEEKFRMDCLGAIDREVPISERNHLGLVLGHIGDPRILSDLRDRAAYIEVPAGDYVYGEDRKPLRMKEPYLLSRYPVTNSQYILFLKDKGYENPGWWSDEGWEWRRRKDIREPLFWSHGTWNGPNQPVVGVSFYEAEAFAQWVGGRLPTEREWEAAARGPEGLVYPWGDKWEDGICNSRESGVRATSPVGIFPRSRSRAFGLEDMAGNVWEWCADYYDRKEAGGARVLRGGSWGDQSWFMRSAYRIGGGPDVRDDDVGFRVVL